MLWLCQQYQELAASHTASHIKTERGSGQKLVESPWEYLIYRAKINACYLHHADNQQHQIFLGRELSHSMRQYPSVRGGPKSPDSGRFMHGYL